MSARGHERLRRNLASEAAEAWLVGEWAALPARALVWARIVEAAQTLKRLPDRERGWLKTNEVTVWPDFLRNAIEAYGDSGLAPARTINRMEETMDWRIKWPRFGSLRVAFLMASGGQAIEVIRVVERFEESGSRALGSDQPAAAL